MAFSVSSGQVICTGKKPCTGGVSQACRPGPGQGWRGGRLCPSTGNQNHRGQKKLRPGFPLARRALGVPPQV